MIAVIALAAVLVIAAIWATWYLAEHGRDRDFADPADDTDPDGTQFLHALHHELPAAGRLAMLPDDPPPDVTIRIPHAHGTWGMPKDELLDELARKHMEVTR